MTTQIIIHGDCREANATEFDVMIADPPYSDHVHKNATSQSAGRGTRFRDLGFDSLSDELRNVIANHAARVKRWSLIYADVEGLGAWLEATKAAKASYIRTVPWVRWSMPQLSGDRPPQGFELVSCYWGSQKGRKSWNGPGNLTHLDHKCLRGEGKHKAEKPLDQALDLVAWFTNQGDIVLDPCAGSGVVGLACKILGRGYVGYEIDALWAERARTRIDATSLSERDTERYSRWVESQKRESEENKRREVTTAKSRAKLEAKRNESKTQTANGSGSAEGSGGEGGESVPCGATTGGEEPREASA